MCYCDALLLCEAELQRVARLFRKRRRSAWMSSYSKETHSARDDAASAFVCDFYAHALQVATFAEHCYFLKISDLDIAPLVFKRSVKQLPVRVRGVCGACECDAALILTINDAHSRCEHAKRARACALLDGLVSVEWREKFAEASSDHASTRCARLKALNTWNWMRHPQHLAVAQAQLLEDLLLNLDKKNDRKVFDSTLPVSEQHLVCHAVGVVLRALVDSENFDSFRTLFSHFCHAQRHQTLALDSIQTRKVFAQVLRSIEHQFAHDVTRHDDAYFRIDNFLLCVWHGRQEYCSDARAQQLVMNRCVRQVLSQRHLVDNCGFALYIACLATQDAGETRSVLSKMASLSAGSEQHEIFRLISARFTLALAHDVIERDAIEAQQLFAEVEEILATFADDAIRRSYVEFDLGLLNMLRRNHADAITHFESAREADAFLPSGTTFFRAHVNLLPVAELRDELKRSPNTLMSLPLGPTARFYSLTCRKHLSSEKLTKRSAHDFAQQVRVALASDEWEEDCACWIEPKHKSHVTHAKAMCHLMAAVVCVMARDRSSAKSQLRHARKLLKHDWPLYTQHMKTLEIV